MTSLLGIWYERLLTANIHVDRSLSSTRLDLLRWSVIGSVAGRVVSNALYHYSVQTHGTF
jgi:hypothetical protein